MARIQYPWITNVLKRLLDVEQGGIPGGFHREVMAVFDMSRRDPELAKEQGIFPWAQYMESPVVAGEFAFVDITALAGAVPVLIGCQPSPSANFSGRMSWSNTGLTAPAAQPIGGLDMRLGYQAMQLAAGLLVQLDSTAALPSITTCFHHIRTLAQTDGTPTPPVVIGPADATGNHLQIAHETVATVLQLNLWGYTLRLV